SWEVQKALDNILEEGIENVLNRHEKIAYSVRKSIEEYGLELFLEEGYSNTVTAIKIPESIGALKLTDYMLKNYNTLVATSLNQYMDTILRIGHMGENANLNKIEHVLNVLDKSLSALGFKENGTLLNLFNKYYF
ncbi:TPA: alanine--glyoxylate aminotransferase family protein, partial [Clostridioides difficile]|nr:alanine--glyoxylate aminotransferase family protein [Clostridioides difficile]HAU5276371.1 alanine--glyoxylate aminotransferase family protein [Clostridioides difficile]HAU5295064.1 alanine--glyoxylate aminotransferase family protein [Clostridioides difficile]HBG5363666.1 alanine--glyoxylate aminotransferase family protein [Clostridioides difficile]HBH2117399.1 alanine--glyoxylate aminotransferase family protein [Clostridioides difficile]